LIIIFVNVFKVTQTILAEEIRQSREIMGIHYPSDNEAARQITHRVLTYFIKTPAFMKAL